MITDSRKRYSGLGRVLDGISGVYALVDPRNSRIMYVGQSLNIGSRYRVHVDPDTYHDNLPKTTWMKDLRKAGLVPDIEVIQECAGPDELDAVERATIRSLKAEGQCELNITVGGDSRAISKTASTSKDDWLQLGNKLKLAAELLDEAETMAYLMVGNKGSSKTRTAIKSLNKLRSDLDKQVHRAFPGWPQASRVFYGPERGET
jgi:hypothetical protein